LVTTRWSSLLALLSAATTAGCTPRTEAPGGSAPAAAIDPGCPREEFLEALHASAFHFQHGSPAVARLQLERARGLAPAPGDVLSTRLLAQLTEISRRFDGEPSWAQSETELVRLALGDWPCLPEALHRRFHQALPALP
jgi:hypothetical protein